MRIVLTGGGSGGHTSAAVGIIGALVDAGLNMRDILWIGSNDGIEHRVAKDAGIQFRVVNVGKFRRYLSFKNLSDIPRVIKGVVESFKALREYSPSGVVSTGGFVSVPVVLASYLLRIPIVVHEQTIVPGLANRIAGRLASKVILTFRDTASCFNRTKTLVIGNPLRPELRKGLRSREEALRRLELDGNLPVLYVTGGALGANVINQIVGDALAILLNDWQIIHQCGDGEMRFGLRYLTEVAGRLDSRLSNRYILKSYIASEISDVFSAADVLLSRSGAAIVNEITQIGLATILVPYPFSIGNEQQILARMLEQAGAAVVLDQSVLTKETLLSALSKLRLKENREPIRKKDKQLALTDVEYKLVDVIIRCFERVESPSSFKS
jgi:UDP-N-acetylglucosamine--N-acetylmuramyl-(pentapeptide) pyrophosphoryl-undecaprenol N-acetylglucosamine transferase